MSSTNNFKISCQGTFIIILDNWRDFLAVLLVFNFGIRLAKIHIKYDANLVKFQPSQNKLPFQFQDLYFVLNLILSVSRNNKVHKLRYSTTDDDVWNPLWIKVPLFLVSRYSGLMWNTFEQEGLKVCFKFYRSLFYNASHLH